MHFLLLRHQLLTSIHLLLRASFHVDYWNSTLKSLAIQNKFLNIVTIEHLWEKLMHGLPEK